MEGSAGKAPKRKRALFQRRFNGCLFTTDSNDWVSPIAAAEMTEAQRSKLLVKIWEVGKAKSGRSNCRRCGHFIEKDSIRFAYPTKHPGGRFGAIPVWLHMNCAAVALTEDEELGKDLDINSLHEDTAMYDDLTSDEKQLLRHTLSNPEPEDECMSALTSKKTQELVAMEPPAGLKADLYPYQKEGLGWMVGQENNPDARGGILADEMGMGKTIQAISCMLKNPKTTLIVCPAAAVLQWKSEILRFAGDQLRPVVFHGEDRNAVLAQVTDPRTVIITTYQTLENEYRRVVNQYKRKCEWCGGMYLPEKLAIHQKYFCGPNAERSAGQQKTKRKDEAVKMMKVGGEETGIALHYPLSAIRTIANRDRASKRKLPKSEPKKSSLLTEAGRQSIIRGCLGAIVVPPLIINKVVRATDGLKRKDLDKLVLSAVHAMEKRTDMEVDEARNESMWYDIFEQALNSIQRKLPPRRERRTSGDYTPLLGGPPQGSVSDSDSDGIQLVNVKRVKRDTSTTTVSNGNHQRMMMSPLCTKDTKNRVVVGVGGAPVTLSTRPMAPLQRPAPSVNSDESESDIVLVSRTNIVTKQDEGVKKEEDLFCMVKKEEVKEEEESESDIELIGCATNTRRSEEEGTTKEGTGTTKLTVESDSDIELLESKTQITKAKEENLWNSNRMIIKNDNHHTGTKMKDEKKPDGGSSIWLHMMKTEERTKMNTDASKKEERKDDARLDRGGIVAQTRTEQSCKKDERDRSEDRAVKGRHKVEDERDEGVDMKRELEREQVKNEGRRETPEGGSCLSTEALMIEKMDLQLPTRRLFSRKRMSLRTRERMLPMVIQDVPSTGTCPASSSSTALVHGAKEEAQMDENMVGSGSTMKGPIPYLVPTGVEKNCQQPQPHRPLKWAKILRSRPKVIDLHPNMYHDDSDDSHELILVHDTVARPVKVIEDWKGVDLSSSRLFRTCWGRVVLDEAHRIKARINSTAMAAYALQSETRWCLSGTPLQNRVGELYSLIRFLQFYPYAHYRCGAGECTCESLHFNFTNEGRCVKCNHAKVYHRSVFSKDITLPIMKYGDVGKGHTAFTKLQHEVLGKLLLRRTKLERHADLNLPPMTVRIRKDELSREEMDFYNSMFQQCETEFSTYVDSGTLLHNYAHVFDLLMRLRQAVDHPYLIVHSKSLKANLPSSSKPSKGTSMLGICALCQDSILCVDNITPGVLAKCGHGFHRDCVEEYIAEAPVLASGEVGCPSCFKPLTVDLDSSVDATTFEEGLDDAEGENGGHTTAHGSSSSSTHLSKSAKKDRSIMSTIDADKFQSSTKIEALMAEIDEMIKKDSTSKALVFSQFVGFLDLIEWRLKRDFVRCAKVTGASTIQARNNIIMDFNMNPNSKVLLISLKAGGEGLNLQVADHVFLLDPWWNPAAELQAMQRAHRIGQTRPLTCVRFFAEKTIEDKILSLQNKKQIAFDITIDLKTSAIQNLTSQDMLFLFQR